MNRGRDSAQPLVFVVEDCSEELARLQAFLQDQGYRTQGFSSRHALWQHLEKLQHGDERPIAVVTDYAIRDNDVAMPRFLGLMDVRLPDTAVLISTAVTSSVYDDGITFPRNTKGVFHRVRDMDKLLDILGQWSARQAKLGR